ncbi:MAG: aminopeptidase N [Bacteriovoracaceae bacterium]|nr:aminopeptidase N [Bacteriovoracaceae bacterium]
MKTDLPKAINLKDYKKPEYTISTIHLTFDLDSTETKVTSVMKMTCHEEGTPLVLDALQLKLLSVKVDGNILNEGRYQVEETSLTINDLPEKFSLEIENKINPLANKTLEGLYLSSGIYCTQNEAEGFRRITYYLDRPDVMAKFTTKIIAKKEEFPVLLSNGNPIDSGDLDNGQHFVEWEDPFNKPAYLYALVAGNLALVTDTFKTMSGRDIDLRIYCDKGNESKCDHAMDSLKKSMKWDEETYGLEYDLDIYMVVAVDSFNMGAMENKGLNIFNSAYVLANPQTATDDDFLGIEGVIGHEYFHNWTGNRITCRDWFQLTLKEGLTVFRDQEFSGDMNSKSVNRVENVNRLRSSQFVEDMGPTAHPIKPASYIEINNFYTATIYEKGAEVIRMLHSFFGQDGFRKGMDKYFDLFDGQAVTTDDFLHAMSVANDNYDLSQFKNWYSQAGTPILDISCNYDEKKQTAMVTVEQSCPSTPGQDHKLPYHLPLEIGLLGDDGKDIPLCLEDVSSQPQIYKGILHVKNASEVFTFKNITSKPTASYNRGFKAPVKTVSKLNGKDLAFLMANDSDDFNRYDACMKSGESVINNIMKELQNGNTPSFDLVYKDAYQTILTDGSLDNEMKSMMLSLPTESIIKQEHNPVNHKLVFDSREWLKNKLGKEFKNEFLSLYNSQDDGEEFSLSPDSIGRRALKNSALSFLACSSSDGLDLAYAQFNSASNMTDEISSFNLLVHYPNDQKEEVIKAFYDKWNHETLVMQKWLSVLASSPTEDTYERVLKLETDSIYDSTVPNLLRSLVGAFARNAIHFHHDSGRGYQFLREKILTIDPINPSMGSRLTSVFGGYNKLEPMLKELMKTELEQIKNAPSISKNTYEIVSKILN